MRLIWKVLIAKCISSGKDPARLNSTKAAILKISIIPNKAASSPREMRIMNNLICLDLDLNESREQVPPESDGQWSVAGC